MAAVIAGPAVLAFRSFRDLIGSEECHSQSKVVVVHHRPQQQQQQQQQQQSQQLQEQTRQPLNDPSRLPLQLQNLPEQVEGDEEVEKNKLRLPKDPLLLTAAAEAHAPIIFSQSELTAAAAAATSKSLQESEKDIGSERVVEGEEVEKILASQAPENQEGGAPATTALKPM